MRSIPDPRETWTAEDARRLFDEWNRIGGSLAEFARGHGIDPARLYWWRKRFASASASPTVTALSLVPATINSSPPCAITIRLPNEIAIELTRATPQEVATLVGELTRSMS
jgi:transposase-like protein